MYLWGVCVWPFVYLVFGWLSIGSIGYSHETNSRRNDTEYGLKMKQIAWNKPTGETGQANDSQMLHNHIGDPRGTLLSVHVNVFPERNHWSRDPLSMWVTPSQGTRKHELKGKGESQLSAGPPLLCVPGCHGGRRLLYYRSPSPWGPATL